MYSRIILLILLPLFAFAQAPQKINFQSILRNTNGEVVANKAVSLRISILSGSITGNTVYSETHTKTTDASGLISLQIGNGTVLSGVFSAILWGNAAYFIKLEADFNGGSNYVLLGTQELMSVPYALYASKTDTSVLNLTNRFSSKLNISDTASMLTNYRNGLNNKLNTSDTFFMLTNYWAGLNNKVNISDTSTMLKPYLRKSDTIVSVETDPVFNTSIANGISGIDTAYWNRKLNTADTSNMLANYIIGLNNKVNVSDTASMLANYLTGINAKVNITDTTAMLIPYLRYADTTNMLANYLTGIKAKVNITDTIGMLVPYLRDADTSAMLANYLTGINAKVNIADTSDMLNPYLRKADAITSGSIETDPVFNISVAKGITGIDTGYWNRKLNISDFPLGTTPGNIQYWNGTTWVNLAPGLPGQVISMSSTGIPSWSGAAFPTLTTSSISAITSTSAYAEGNISSDGGASVMARGLVYGTTSNPTLSNSVLTIGSGVGGYAGTISGLTPNTTYYIRAYATNSPGTGYGNEITFQTLPVEVPTLVTTDASGITQTTVTSGGTVSNDGGATINERGIVYSTSSNPTTSDTKVTSGSGTGSFNVNVTDLTPNTTYYIRSYAINSAGTGYGNNITFQTTVPAVPSLTTREILNITNTTATGGGSITNDGGSSITAKGICWGTSPNPTTADSKTTDGTGTETFASFITGLSATVTYFVRAYATNSMGTGYGNQQTFTTSSTSNTLPEVISTNVTDLTTIQATLNAEVSSQGGGTVTERGAVWNTTGNPTVNSNRVSSGSGTGVYTVKITSLSAGSKYYIRAYAINNFGISYGDEISFTTLFGLATLTTNSVIYFSTTASSGGNIMDNGGSTVTARGVVWNTSGKPTISDTKSTDGSGIGSYVSSMTALSPGTTYHVRSYATNSTGTAYGNEISFTTTATTQPVTDIDGNTYNTVQIGTQVWMSENLKTSRYRNGGSIPYVVGNTEWGALTTGAWSNYDHDVAANNSIYGKLYNWYATLGDTLCPTGWHVPIDAEWTTLTDYLGGESVAGGKMKSVGTQYWNDPNIGANNESGFSAVPGGFRNFDGSFDGILNFTFFWSSAEINNSLAWYRNLDYNYSDAFRNSTNGSVGASVRCLKD